MDTETSLRQPAQNAAPGFQSGAGTLDEPASSGLSVGFIIFAILLIGAAALAGSLKSGKLTLTQLSSLTQLNHFFNAPKPVAPAKAPVVPPVPPPKPGSFVVTSVSLGQPSYAIINGTSHTVGDPLEAPGVTGWKLNRILDGAVWLQNGSTLVALPLSTPGIKALDDQLHPLN